MNQNEMEEYFERKFGYFYQTEPLESIQSSLHYTQFDYIYDAYDQLIENFPQRISRRCLGHAYNLQGEIDEDFPIYEYTIRPIETTQLYQDEEDTLLVETPVILLLSGVHGGEKAATYGLFQVIKQMLTNPYQHLRVDRMQSRFTFKVVPVATPGGYNIPARENPRGININRNFGYGKVETPYSERETQIICQWLEENQGSFAFFDCHNFVRNFLPTRQVSMSSYHISPNPEVNRVYSDFIRQISPLWKEKYLDKYRDQGDIAYGFLLGKQYNETPSTVNEAFYKYNYQITATIESSNQDPDDLDQFNTVKVLEMTVDIYMNYLLAITEHFYS